MSEAIKNEIQQAEKSLNELFEAAPYLVKNNHMFASVTGISRDLLNILKMQAFELESARQDIRFLQKIINEETRR